jgi:murein DD-endopeptidase MepM/ murein hydrolase activator NlpD
VYEITGTAAGEVLHFWTADGRSWSALAGVPMEGGDSLTMTLVLATPTAHDTIQAALAVAAPPYEVERLRVAPRMAQPDSAAQRRIAREAARAREVGRTAQETPRLWEVPFVPPRTSRITSAFGTGREFNGEVLSRHLGTDFAGAVGDPVVATSRGRVALVVDFYLAGRAVYIDHGEGLVSAYFHLSRALVKPGDIVERGQRIGLVGQSGRVTGPHLHWVMRYGGVTVDPMSVLALLGGKSEE